MVRWNASGRAKQVSLCADLTEPGLAARQRDTERASLSAQYTCKFKQRHRYLARPDARYLGAPGAHNLTSFRRPGRPHASVSCRVAALRVPSRSNLRKEKSTWHGWMRAT